MGDGAGAWEGDGTGAGLVGVSVGVITVVGAGDVVGEGAPPKQDAIIIASSAKINTSGRILLAVYLKDFKYDLRQFEYQILSTKS